MSGNLQSNKSTAGPAGITKWLQDMQLGEYTPQFIANGINVEDLPRLTEQDLKKMGVNKIAHRAHLLSAAARTAVASSLATSIPSPVSKPAPTGRSAGVQAPVMSSLSAPLAVVGVPAQSSEPKKSGIRRFGVKFLVLSILAHLFFGVGAAYYIVQRVQANRKLTFQGGPPNPNPSTRALEHKMNMTRKSQTMSAPAQAKRIATTGISKISLPDMPEMPSAATIAPNMMAGMGGVGVGFAPNAGGMGAGGGTGGGGGMPLFGLHDKPSYGTLKGTLIDLKQFKNRSSSNMNQGKCDGIVVAYGKAGFPEHMVEPYFKSSKAVYTTQFFIPEIPSEEGPKAFGLGGIVKPDMWIVHYTGRVAPPATGTFYFVGEADDYMYVKFDGKVVLDSCWVQIPSFLQPTAVYKYGSSAYPLPFKRSKAIHVEAGNFYNIEIVIGDHGGQTNTCLLFEQEGVEYAKDGKGNPILPPFRVANNKLPPTPPKMTPLKVMEDGPIWSAEAEPAASALDVFKARTD